MNDTTGCLIACAYKHPDCRVGVIIGTGTNASYVEKLELVDLYEGDKPLEKSEVVINTEWGAFGNTGSLDVVRTIYDYELDRDSLNPGKQVYAHNCTAYSTHYIQNVFLIVYLLHH